VIFTNSGSRNLEEEERVDSSETSIICFASLSEKFAEKKQVPPKPMQFLIHGSETSEGDSDYSFISVIYTISLSCS
jgi:hypothetical protein